MSTSTATASTTSEDSVYNRYAAAAQQREEALCCPVEYPTDFLSVIPQEIIERDYGCGDPTRFVHEGETVVDLGSGGGKLCYIMSQVVGPRGRVIGVDCNLEMLSLARKYRPEVAQRVGYGNVEFRYGMIQDLQLDLDLLEQELAKQPVSDSSGWLTLRNVEERLKRSQPLIESNTVDCVVSNCVLNLVRQQDRRQLFAEIFRVLKSGGRAAISDIVSDQDVPRHMQENPELWSGCISGAFREDLFLQAFEDAGFHGVEIAKRQSEPWRTVEGIEFRSVTVVADKGKPEPGQERNQPVVYRGPLKQVMDDEGNIYSRGVRKAVSAATCGLLHQAPYSGMFYAIEPQTLVQLGGLGLAPQSGDSSGSCCSPGGSCC
jgi:SAM-dependent methyltransferase